MFEVVPETLNVRAGPGIEFDILDTLSAGEFIEEIPGWCPIPMEDGSIGWVARFSPSDPLRKYLREAKEDAVPTRVIQPAGGEPDWITWARKQIGQKEIPGPASNPVIQAWYHLTTLPESMWTDSTAWCAVFVNAALMLTNHKSLRSARAVDWLKFGSRVSEPQKGDITVFDWGNGSHHVNFFLRDIGGGRIECLGGNQNDAVSITSYPESAVMGYRRPA